MATAWSTLERSELVSWFGVHVVDRGPVDGGERIRAKPAGFVESIDLEFLVVRGDVARAELRLDRVWAGLGLPRAEAIDLAKSFVFALAPPDGPASRFGRAVERLLEIVPGIVMRDPRPEPDVLEPDVATAVEVVMGRSTGAAVVDRTTRIMVESVTTGVSPHLTFTISSAGG